MWTPNKTCILGERGGREAPPEWKVSTDGFPRLPRAPPSELRSRPAGAPRRYARQRLLKKFSAAAPGFVRPV